MRAWLSAVGLMALLLAPEVSQACSVCFSAREETRAAFLGTTIFLTALPPVLIGAVIWWLRHRARQLRQTESDLRETEAA